MFMHAIGIIYMGFLLFYLFACNAIGTVRTVLFMIAAFRADFNFYFVVKIKFPFASVRFAHIIVSFDF